MTAHDAPWTVQALATNHNDYAEWRTFAIRSRQNCCIAVVGEVDRYQQERTEADALLMSAAPELEECLRGATGYLLALPEKYRPDEAWLAPIYAAIAKARGREVSV